MNSSWKNSISVSFSVLAMTLFVQVPALAELGDNNATLPFGSQMRASGKIALHTKSTYNIDGKPYWFEVIEFAPATGDTNKLENMAHLEFVNNHTGKLSFPANQNFYWKLANGSQMVLCVWGGVNNSQNTWGWAAFDRQGASAPNGPTWRVIWGGNTAVVSAPGHWRTMSGHPPIVGHYLPGVHHLDNDETAILRIGSNPNKGAIAFHNPKNVLPVHKKFMLFSIKARP